MTAQLIDCGIGVIRLTIADDHAHLEVSTPSVTDADGYHCPAESAVVHLDADAIRQLIGVLQSFRPPLRAVERIGH